MPNDIYEQYRKPLTQEELQDMPEAERKSRLMAEDAARPDGKLRRVENGYEQKGDGTFLPDPVTTEYMSIAMERADTQFEGWPVMPEDTSVMQRFPGVDPVKKYSTIDMKFAQRVAKINASLESRSPQVKEYTNSLMAMVRENSAMRDINLNMTMSAQKHRTVSRAAKLCLDETGRKLLQMEARILETSTSVMEMDMYLQGAEFAAGVRTGPVPKEVQDFYENRLKTKLDLDRIKEAEKLDHTPREVKVEFQNLDHKLQQAVFANPKNWEKKPKQITKEDLAAERVDQSVLPYACATADRVINPLFTGVENMNHPFSSPINRADNIIVGGKTVREKMYEEFMAVNQDPTMRFEEYFDENFQQKTSEYVAGALMAGERVEAFIPDKDGRIPDEPVQITKTGYEPSPLNPVTLNAWERFWSKRGFYKEKAAAAVEYQRTMDARERVKSTNVTIRADVTSGGSVTMKDMFFSDWKEKNGPLPDSVPHGYSASRAALSTTAICVMAAKGYDIKDIFDPNKLQTEKKQIGSALVDRMMKGDQKWMGEVLFHGQRCIMDQIDRYCTQINIMDNKQLFQAENHFLFSAAHTAFDASQETKNCKAEYAAAAERFAPGNGPQAMAQVDNRVNPMGDFFSNGITALKAYNQLAGGMIPASYVDTMGIQHILNFESARTALGAKIAANPNAPVSSYLTIDDMNGYAPSYACSLSETLEVKKLAQYLENPNNQKTFGRELLQGTAQKRIHIELDERDPFNAKFHMDAPTKQEKTAESTHRDMQQIAQKTAPKPMAGPHK